MCNLTLPPRQKIFLQHYMEGLVLHSILFAILCESPFKSSVTVQLHSPSTKVALLLLALFLSDTKRADSWEKIPLKTVSWSL